MANRIYIAVGLVAILILGAAFIVPWLIDWNSYKARMEEMTAQALGIEVAIEGDLDFVLLPQPRMRIEGVRLGPVTHPLAEAQYVEADFSLMDFLRDRFSVTQLRLAGPHINLTIDETGHIETPITLAETADASNVSIASARFEDAIVTVTDMRSGQSRAVSGFAGDMRMTGMRGPFALQGEGEFEGGDYAIRIATSAMNAEGHMQVTSFLRPADGRYSVSLDGLLRTGADPVFEGQGVFRQPVDSEDGVAGDLVLSSPVTATTAEVLLPGFTFLPNEDQAATRMTGSASVTLGAQPRFNAVVSGGVVTLLPRQVTEDSIQPFELVRMLREMPQPVLPPLPGRIGVDINELVLRGTGLREVRLDAVTNGELWRIEEFSGRLAGDTTLRLEGTLGRQAGWPAFDGRIDVSARRLDALSLLWRRTEEGNPLFNMPGQLTGDVRMTNGALRLSNGLFVLDGSGHDLAAHMRFGEQPSLEVDARLSRLGANRSAALLALLPPIDPAGPFGLSFPQGRLDLAAEGGVFAGLPFSDVTLGLDWGEGRFSLGEISIGDFGGAGFDGWAELGGTLDAPVVWGSGELSLAPDGAMLARLPGLDAGPLARAVAGSLPANLHLVLGEPAREGSQALTLEGRAGQADIWLSADIAGGAGNFGRGRTAFAFEAAAESGAELMTQLGLAPIIAGEDGALLTLSGDGNPAASMEMEMTLEGGGERIDFTGTVVTSDLMAPSGQGMTSFLFTDVSALAELAGAPGIWFPGVEGQAEIAFAGGQSVALTNIAGFAGEANVAGDLNYAAQSNSALVSGALRLDMLDLDTLLAMTGGPAATIRSVEGEWADGPLDTGQTARRTRGRIAMTAPELRAGERVLLEALAFDYAWDNEATRLRGLMGEIGGGTLELDAALCCASVLADKSLTGRFSLNGVALDALVGGAPADVLDGTVTAGGEFQANGDSFRALVGGLTGSGSISVADLSIARTSPGVFARAAGLDNIIELEPEALEAIVVEALDGGPFVADEAGSLYSLTGGTARVSNVVIEGEGARLVGGGSLGLADLSTSSDWTLALTRPVGGNELITETTGRVGIAVSGPLRAPERTLNLTQMVDAIQMRAFEIELDELERLRAEQEARQRAAAEEQARLMEEEARRQAEELLRQQQEEAERLEAEERLRQLEELERQLQLQTPEPEPAVPPPSSTPSILQLPPGALQLDPFETGR